MSVCRDVCAMHISMYIYMYVYTNIHALETKRTILNAFLRRPSPNTCSVADLYLNSGVNSSGSSPSHYFSSIPNLSSFSRNLTLVIKLYKVADEIPGSGGVCVCV